MATYQWDSFFSDKGEVNAWTSLKTGGVSVGDYESLNLSFDVQDNHDHVLENRHRVRQKHPTLAWVEVNQVHQTRCLWIDEKQISTLKHPFDPFTYLVGEADALLTRCPGITLVIKHADCQPGLLFDPITRTIGAVHAGWRGLIGGIYFKCLEAMLSRGSQIEDIRILIGPSLQACCAEFKNWKNELGEKAQRFEKKPFHFSLTQLLESDLLDLGVLKNHMHIDLRCTYCHEQKMFYSFRRENRHSLPTGRHMSGICLKDRV